MIRSLSIVRRVASVAALAAVLSFAPLRARAEDSPSPDFVAEAVIQLPQTERPLQLLEGRLVLLTFLNTWSDHCAAAVPHLNKIQARLGGRGLTVLAVTEATVEDVQPWVDEKGVTFAFALIGALENEKLRVALSVPADPHAALISPSGEVLWTGHPQALKEPEIKRHLVGVKAPPPSLPAALAEQQALLADGRWAAARTSLAAVVDGLDKETKDWARGLIEWIDERRGTWLAEADAYAADGRFWDAWQMYTDFGRRFEGMEGATGAQEKADAVRANADAAKDLALGDDVAKARVFVDEGKTRQARLILGRVTKQGKGTVHAERANALLAGMK